MNCIHFKKMIPNLFFLNLEWSNLEEVRVNIKDEHGCGGQNLRVVLERDGVECSTRIWGSFNDGATLSWTGNRLENCRDFKIDHLTKFGLRVGSSIPYCPVKVAFNTSSTKSYVSHLDLEYSSSPWYSRADNSKSFYVDPIVEQDFTCPRQAQGCPVHELVAFERTSDKFKQCVFT